jgi:hypothetical protein
MEEEMCRRSSGGGRVHLGDAAWSHLAPLAIIEPFIVKCLIYGLWAGMQLELPVGPVQANLSRTRESFGLQLIVLRNLLQGRERTQLYVRIPLVDAEDAWVFPNLEITEHQNFAFSRVIHDSWFANVLLFIADTLLQCNEFDAFEDSKNAEKVIFFSHATLCPFFASSGGQHSAPHSPSI